MSLARIVEADYVNIPAEEEGPLPSTLEEMEKMVEQLERQMRQAAQAFEFEKAARLRDRVKALKTRDLTGAAEASG
jgi:excinuclease ABC subunit B